MLDAYKRKFIISNMLMVGTVLSLMLVVTFVYSYYSNISSLKETMSQLTEPFENSTGSPDRQLDAYSVQDEHQPKLTKKPDSEPGQKPDEAMPEQKISVFFYDMDKKAVSLLSKPLISDEDSLIAIADKIASSPDSFGKLKDEKIYFYKIKTNRIVKIATANMGLIRNSALEMLCVMLLVFSCAMLLFYIISRHLAKFAIRPLETALAMERQFIADTSHDLKTPVAVVLANMGILERHREASVSDMMLWVDRTKTAAENMQKLIEEMLVLSDLDAIGYGEVELSPVNISQSAEKTALYMEPVAYEKGIGYYADIQAEILAIANEEYMERIFQALISNAVKYEPKDGEIAISLSLQHGKAVFSVNNKAAAIPEEDLPYIFERFYRSDKSRGNNGGHGLGLAIVKRMADLMNCRIEVQSCIGEGTTFRLFIGLARNQLEER